MTKGEIELERNQNPVNYVLNYTKKIVPAFRYKGEDFSQWQSEAKAKLAELLGLPFEKCDDNFKIEYEEEKEGYKEIRFSFQSEEGYFVPCHLLIPENAQKPLPVVLCLQGHSSGMHISLGRIKFEGDEKSISGGDRDFAIGAIKRGYCALAIEQRGMGECGGNEKGPQCHVHTMANLLVGRTTIGERVWDVSRTIDIIEKNFSDIIDTNNIICLGNSGGGTTTFYAACLEERIKTAISSCAVASYDESISAMNHCVCNFVPNIRKYFDMGDLGGLIAPRNLLIVSGVNDSIFPIDSAKKCFERIKAIFEKNGGICRHIVGPEGHRFYYDLAWAEFDKIH